MSCGDWHGWLVLEGTSARVTHALGGSPSSSCRRFCEVCGCLAPRYSYGGGRDGKRCTRHREPGMVDVTDAAEAAETAWLLLWQMRVPCGLQKQRACLRRLWESCRWCPGNAEDFAPMFHAATLEEALGALRCVDALICVRLGLMPDSTAEGTAVDIGKEEASPGSDQEDANPVALSPSLLLSAAQIPPGSLALLVPEIPPDSVVPSAALLLEAGRRHSSTATLRSALLALQAHFVVCPHVIPLFLDALRRPSDEVDKADRSVCPHQYVRAVRAARGGACRCGRPSAVTAWCRLCGEAWCATCGAEALVGRARAVPSGDEALALVFGAAPEELHAKSLCHCCLQKPCLSGSRTEQQLCPGCSGALHNMRLVGSLYAQEIAWGTGRDTASPPSNGGLVAPDSPPATAAPPSRRRARGACDLNVFGSLFPPTLSHLVVNAKRVGGAHGNKEWLAELATVSLVRMDVLLIRQSRIRSAEDGAGLSAALGGTRHELGHLALDRCQALYPSNQGHHRWEIK